jgi:uncharacterized membrane protein
VKFTCTIAALGLFTVKLTSTLPTSIVAVSALASKLAARAGAEPIKNTDKKQAVKQSTKQAAQAGDKDQTLI